MEADTDLTRAVEEQYRMFRAPLLELAERYQNKATLKRFDPEDIVQEVFASALSHPDYLTSHPEVPPYYKWRTLLFHMLSNTEYAHMKCQKRDVQREVSFSRIFGDSTPEPEMLDRLLKSVSTPCTKAEQGDCSEILAACIRRLSPEEQRIITLRQFDRCTSVACAKLLGITHNEAKACYIRALRHLRKALAAYSELLP